MGPRPRDWLGAGILAVVLVVFILVLVTTAMGAPKSADALLHLLG
jgi:hypothetical protein